MGRSFRDEEMAVGDAVSDQLLLVKLQSLRIFQRRKRASTEEENYDLLIEVRRVRQRPEYIGWLA